MCLPGWRGHSAACGSTRWQQKIPGDAAGMLVRISNLYIHITTQPSSFVRNENCNRQHCISSSGSSCQAGSISSLRSFAPLRATSPLSDSRDISFNLRGRAMPMLPQLIYCIYSISVTLGVMHLVHDYRNVKQLSDFKFAVNSMCPSPSTL